MNYEDLLKKSLKVEWKVSLCPSGLECWCRVIEPKEPLIDNEENEFYIVGSGSIPKEHAEHIVKLHNEKIKNGTF